MVVALPEQSLTAATVLGSTEPCHQLKLHRRLQHSPFHQAKAKASQELVLLSVEQLEWQEVVFQESEGWWGNSSHIM